MTVPRKPKPEEAAETARVMRIFDWLVEELDKRSAVSVAGTVIVGGFSWREQAVGVLTVAERIAARTESV